MRLNRVLHILLLVLLVVGAAAVTWELPPAGVAGAESASVRLNEFLPAPHDVDWNGDGRVSSSDEWIELFNAGTSPVDLSGWQLDDQAGGHSPYTFPQGVSIAPGEYLVTYRSFGLNNGGDEVRLISPDGAVVDSYAYDHSEYDRSFSRSEAGGWVDYYPPSPGGPNVPPTATPIPSPTPTPTPRAWRFWGHVHHGLPGSGGPLPGVRVSLYGSDLWEERGDFLGSSTSGFDGWFGIFTDKDYDFYTLVASPPGGYLSAGAASGSGGEPDGPARLRFAYPPPGFHVDNDFWAILPGDGPTPTPAPTPHPPGGFGVLITEVCYDPPKEMSPEKYYEWVELFNANPYTVTVRGWRLRDNLDSDVLPNFVIGPRSFAVVAPDEGNFLRTHPGFQGVIVQVYDGVVGNGLGNGGDRLRLLNGRYEMVDAVSWGKDRSSLDPPAQKVKSGHTLCRVPTDADTDTSADWGDCATPSPGDYNLQDGTSQAGLARSP